jgi:mannose-6-phosphate isomerase-like protein (cupin superfamily)
MADYTRANLKTDVDDLAPKFGFAPNLEARFARRDLELTRSGMSYQRLAPSFRMPFGHRHGEQEEVYVVLSGSARAKLDDEVVELGPMDALRVAGTTMRALEAGPEGVELLAFGAPHTGPEDALTADDTEMVRGWWT